MKKGVDFKLGHDLAMKNAKAHLRSAELIASNNISYGIANSHLILASEEIIKAYMCYAKFFEPGIEIKGFDSYFKDHKQKHKAISQLSFAINFFKTMTNIIIEPVKNLKAKKGWNFTDKELIKSRDQGFEDILAWLNSIPNIDHNEHWWNEANTNKNKGFYVDVINNKWLSPENITKEEYERSYAIVNEILKYMMLIPRYEKDPEMKAAYEEMKAFQENRTI